MVRKAFCVPALVTGFIAVVLLVLTVVSMPTTYHKATPFDIVRASNLQGMLDLTPGAKADQGLQKARFGIWGYCTEALDSDRFASCTHDLTNMYTAVFASADVSGGVTEQADVTKGYTRG